MTSTKNSLKLTNLSSMKSSNTGEQESETRTVNKWSCIKVI